MVAPWIALRTGGVGVLSVRVDAASLVYFRSNPAHDGRDGFPGGAGLSRHLASRWTSAPFRHCVYFRRRLFRCAAAIVELATIIRAQLRRVRGLRRRSVLLQPASPRMRPARLFKRYAVGAGPRRRRWNRVLPGLDVDRTSAKMGFAAVRAC